MVLKLTSLIFLGILFPDKEHKYQNQPDWEPISYECRYCDLKENPDYIWKRLFKSELPSEDKDSKGVVGEEFFSYELAYTIKLLNGAWFSEDEFVTLSTGAVQDTNFYPLKYKLFSTLNQSGNFKDFLFEKKHFLPEYEKYLEDDTECLKPIDIGWSFVQKYFTQYSPIYAEKTISAFEKDFFSYVDICISEIETLLAEYRSGKRICHFVDKNRNRICIPHCEKKLEYFYKGVPNAKKILNRTKDIFINRIHDDIENCLNNRESHPERHNKDRSIGFFDRGYARFLLGDFFHSMQDIENYLQTDPENPQILQLLGETSSSLALYHNAVDSLSKVINKNPKNQKAYFERAIAYFEIGNFEKALEDYLKSDSQVTFIDESLTDYLNFSAGIIKGTISGAADSMENFVPSMLCTLQGLANGIWTFACSPKEVSKELVVSSKNMVLFLKENANLETIKLLVPELQDLLVTWYEIEDFRKGELVGEIIGKYGIDVFFLAGASKGMQAFQDLKRANAILTMENMKILEKRKLLQEVSSKWEHKAGLELEKIKLGRLKDNKELFRKYRNQNLSEYQIRKILHGAGYSTYPKPIGIPDNWKVEITKKGGGMKYINPENKHEFIRIQPGNPGSSNSVQKKPYIIHQKAGKAIDKNGNLVSRESVDAHVPLNEFRFKHE